MKVILDGVFNHCGSFNKWMDRERIYEGCDAYEKGAYVAQESSYHDFFPSGRAAAGRITARMRAGGITIPCPS